MDAIERARIRLESWIFHNEHHSEAYESLITLLEDAGRSEAAGELRESIEWTSRSNQCLRRALEAINRKPALDCRKRKTSCIRRRKRPGHGS